MAEENEILCIHKENGKQRLCPAHWFKDKALAMSLDWVPMEGKSFEDQISPDALEKLRKEKEAENKNKSESEEKKHHNVLIKEINDSTDKDFVLKHTLDSRESVKSVAVKRLEELNK